MTHAPDPRALALSDAEAYDDLRAQEWEGADRTDDFGAPMLRVAEATMVPTHGAQTEARAVDSSPPASSPGAPKAEPPSARPHSDDDPGGWSMHRRPSGESPCPRCGGEEVVAVGGPDRFGNYETTDCQCAYPKENT